MGYDFCDDVIERPTEFWALIEGPRWADTEFYGNWLLAAAKANELWTEALKNPRFSRRVDLLTAFELPDFSIGATLMLSRLEQNLASFVVSLNEQSLPKEFAMMIELRFFALTGQRYQMVIPTRLTLRKVMKAALRLVKTEAEGEDGVDVLHPEYIITTMPYAEIKAWQSRLRGMDETHRQADRVLLLGTYPDPPPAVASWNCS
jgi:hypothetical protein